jgi:hypothetical protein
LVSTFSSISLVSGIKTHLPPLAFTIVPLEEALVIGDMISAENEPLQKSQNISMKELYPDA